MAENFDRSIGFVFKWEGGYVNRPDDPGGETKYGISRRAYPSLDIKSLTEAQAMEVYRKDYWEKAGCGSLEWPLCLVVFDTAVNMGVGRALEFREKAFNWTEYLFLRVEFYNQRAAKTPAFLRGWINRVIDLYKTCKAA